MTSGVVDLQPLLFHFTLSTTFGPIFGQSIETLTKKEQADFANSFDYASFIYATNIRLVDLYRAYTPRRYTRACDTVRIFASDYVEQALREKSDAETEASIRFAFIHELHDELQDPALDRDQLVHVMVAGRDTTACLMSWTL